MRPTYVTSRAFRLLAVATILNSIAVLSLAIGALIRATS